MYTSTNLFSFQKKSEEILKGSVSDKAFIDEIIEGAKEEIGKLSCCSFTHEDFEDFLVSVITELRIKGQYAYYTEKIYAVLLSSLIDTNKDIREEVKEKAKIKFTDVTYLLSGQIRKLLEGKFHEEKKYVEFLRSAYEKGFLAEINYRGCGQCTLAALLELLDIRDDALFQATTGFSGGMSLCGDGVCGGYAGSLLMFGKLRGRDFERMLRDKDKENQYACYTASQMMHDKFVSCYGSPICKEVHKAMFDGDFYILREKANRDRFEEAGAHTEKCTTVVATATMFAAEIMLEMGLTEI